MLTQHFLPLAFPPGFGSLNQGIPKNFYLGKPYQYKLPRVRKLVEDALKIGLEDVMGFKMDPALPQPLHRPHLEPSLPQGLGQHDVQPAQLPRLGCQDDHTKWIQKRRNVPYAALYRKPRAAALTR